MTVPVRKRLKVKCTKKKDQKSRKRPKAITSSSLQFLKMCLEFCNKFNYLDQNKTTVKKVMTWRHMRTTHPLTFTVHHQPVVHIISTQVTDCLQNSVHASCAFTVHITNSVFPVTTVWFLVLNEIFLFHGAILPYLNKYCNVMQMYCHVQFYITSLEYCSLGL